MIAVLTMSLFSELFKRHRREDTEASDRRRDVEMRRAYAEKVELEAAVDAIVRERQSQERQGDRDG